MYRLRIYILLLLLLLPTSFYSVTLKDVQKKYNVIVLPADISRSFVLGSHSNIKYSSLDSSLKEGLTKLLQTYFAFSGIRVVDYRSSLKVLDLINRNNLGYKDITKYSSKLANLDYIIVTNLHELNNRNILVVKVIDPLTGNVLFLDKHSLSNVSSSKFFKVSSSSRLSIRDNSVFSLVNPLSQRVVNFIKNSGNSISRQDRTRREGRLLQLMFIIDDTPSLAVDLSLLKDKLREIVSVINSKDENIIVEFAFIGNKLNLPFNANLLEIENTIDNINMNYLSQDFTSFEDKLYKALMDKGWSFSDDDIKLIFVLANDPFKGGISIARRSNIAISPLKFHNLFYRENDIDIREDIYLLKDFVYKELSKIDGVISKRELNLVYGTTKRTKDIEYYNRRDSIISQLRVNYKVHYIINSFLEKNGDGYNLVVQVNDINTNKVVYSLYNRYTKGSLFNKLKEEIIAIKYKLSNFFHTLILEKERGFIENIKRKDFSRIVDLARSKAINIYAILSSASTSYGDTKKKSILSGLTRSTGGDTVNLKYSIKAYLTNDEKVNFVFSNNKLYEIKRNAVGNKAVLLSSKINKVEDVKTFLTKLGYSINMEKAFSIKIEKMKGIFNIINNKLMGYDAGSAASEFVLKSGNYYYPFSLRGLSGDELDKIDFFIKTKKEIVVASPIVPVIPYKVQYQGNNKVIGKLVKFALSRARLNIFLPEDLSNKAISSIMEVSIEDINKDVHSFSNIGLIQDRNLWFIRGILTKRKVK